MKNISSWGRTSREAHVVLPLRDRFRLDPAPAPPGLPLGNGRSYGDVCLNPGGTLWDCRMLDRFMSFDAHSGILACEAGVLLRDIQRLAVPRGWMLPVTPGTQLVTVGGAIANDVHGKNHHSAGTFGNHVRAITLIRTDGEVISCGPGTRDDWFAATLGGMGLTGVITQAELQLRPVPGPWLETETIAFGGLDEFFRLAQASDAQWEYTVAWIDCIGTAAGRGLFMRGNHADVPTRPDPRERHLKMPVVPPVSLVNRWSLRPFNAAYYALGRRRHGKALTHYQPFFYPLDHIEGWNRMYGPRGFFQYQSLVPRHLAPDAVKAMLAEVAKSGEGSFLAVLKVFGDRPSLGMMSFAAPGVTLALDVPNNGARTERLFDRLDAIVRAARGRIYTAKDARMPRDLFEAGYPRLQEFVAYRDRGISSAMSRRLMGS